ncbi:PCNA-interacting partner isoform X14 [Sorex fumeus]|uniref:PCNA-interacting partner isoform X14 n=1 Tax=Sorex fumeus TaxID=62283 RepID=UPI0024AE0EFC|nr:PCNA-interacting partner isoform X14 [Sorex fumeus]
MAVLSQKSVLDMIKEFRRNWHTLCYSERTTVCGADAMLSVLQLSMAENNKRQSGEFEVSLSDVLLTWKYLLHDKLNIPVEDMEMIDHYEDIRRTYDDCLRNSNMLDLIDVYQKCSAVVSNCENNTSISPSQLLDFLSGRQNVVNDATDPYILRSPMSKHTQDNEKVATSFIRALELGGKGYAPSPSDPLRTHVKGLSNFINFIDKLDEILGEIPNPRSPTQVNNLSIKPLRERIHESVQEKKIKMRQTLIRSQFACTYKDDYMINKNKRNNVDPASEPLSVLHMKNDLSESVSSSVGRPTFGSSSGNVHLDRSKNEKARKPSSQTGNKSSKRKQVDLDDENILCDNGNEPPQHKNVKLPKISNNLQNKVDGKLTKVAKINKSTSKNKLLTGQTKLTQFFRL